MNKENLLQIQYFLSDNNVCKFTFISEIMKSLNSPDYSFFAVCIGKRRLTLNTLKQITYNIDL